MRIVFFSHYFPPEGNAPASRTYDHCVRWVNDPERNVSVTVVTCAPNVPDGQVYDGYRNPLWPRREVVDGVQVVRVWTYIRPNPGRVGLIVNYLSYLVSSLFAFVFFVRRPDVIVATTPQFFCGIAGVLASWLKWRPLVLEVRDIWPESIVTVGALRRGWIVKALESMERWMYRQANHIVAVGPGYRDNILSKADVADHLSVVTNGVDPTAFLPRADCENVRQRYDLGKRFVCSYVGTVGMAHGLDILVRAAKRYQQAGRDDVVFLIAGGGARLEELRSQVESQNLGHFLKLTGRVDKSLIPDVLAASDVCLVHLNKVDLFQHVIPSKIFETMAMERPIIMGVRGRARDIVLEAGCGVALEPENDEQLIQILDQMESDPQATRRMGQCGRQFVVRHFNRDTLAADMLTVIQRTAAGDSRALPDRDWNSPDHSVEPDGEAGTKNARKTAGQPLR
ncbi:glycosyltransferase family 4 protein [Roseiconus nitratireducens]|uniref:Glycosyltransferase family 4 protein n=1 Tax=Roseiconus nitratireducens TaxID=2605748 RepID=A0A5M6CUJ1_9BACT|nr:glycosyltransferase family 4 protein [Roseiconus nitratireducens]KAA5538904.1 glycosyltransferase family 4 protein [Roseiconus nitratireducens]